jgi:hypothetical protein
LAETVPPMALDPIHTVMSSVVDVPSGVASAGVSFGETLSKATST